MTNKILTAATLLIVSQLAQAQGGVVSPVANPQPAPAAEAAAEPTVPAAQLASSGGFNPFRPPTTAPTPANLPPPRPPVDPAIQALAEELQEIREKGERIGVVDGQVIFRYEGRYLVEPVRPEELMAAEGDFIDPQKREAALAGECVIQVVTGSSAMNTRAVAIQ